MKGFLQFPVVLLFFCLVFSFGSCELFQVDDVIEITGTWVDPFGGGIEVTESTIDFGEWAADIHSFSNDGWNEGEEGSGDCGYAVLHYTLAPSWNPDLVGKYMVFRWKDLTSTDEETTMSYSEGYNNETYFDTAGSALETATTANGYFDWFTDGAVRQDDRTPIPGDPDYVPPGWVIPALAYERDEYTPARVVEVRQSPGQHANSGSFSPELNAEKLMGYPSGGGTAAPDNSGVVSLGMAGGYVIVGFDPPIENHPDNIGGYDFIIFGNTFWPGPTGTSREPGLVYVMNDDNGNGEPDDTWYLIGGSHRAELVRENVLYDSGDIDASWWPEGAGAELAFPGTLLLPEELYSQTESVRIWGYADVTPTLKRGDMSGAARDTAANSISEEEDYPGIDPLYFYTVPDSHETEGIDPGSGGGDAIKLEWAVYPDTLEPVVLERINWIKIVSANMNTDPSLGDFSPEVDAVTRVRRKTDE